MILAVWDFFVALLLAMTMFEYTINYLLFTLRSPRRLSSIVEMPRETIFEFYKDYTMTHESGIAVIHWLQQFRSPLLDNFFIVLTHTGKGYAYLFVVCLLFWVFDRRWGFRILVVFFLSYWVNSVAKDIFMQPRPFAIETGINIIKSGGPGMPSSHAQGALVLWSMLSMYVRRWWFYCIAGFMILGVALSRVYLGVHFPADIFGGWLLGGVVLGAYLIWNRYYGRIQDHEVLLTRIALCLVLAGALLLAKNYWTTYPLGLIAGALVGYILNEKTPGTPGPGKMKWWKPVVRMCTGFPVLLLIIWLTRLLASAAGHGTPELITVFTGFTLCGLWISTGASYIFRFMKI